MVPFWVCHGASRRIFGIEPKKELRCRVQVVATLYSGVQEYS